MLIVEIVLGRRFAESLLVFMPVVEKLFVAALGKEFSDLLGARHDIEIAVKSKLGEGSTFTLTIPTI